MFVINNFLSLIVFTLPGFLTYFWIQMLGINPASKHSSVEMAALSALFWAPTTFITIVTYNMLYLIFDCIARLLNLDLSMLKMELLLNMSDLNTLSGNLYFLFIYVIFSTVFSLLVATIGSLYVYKHILGLINKLRVQRNLSKLSDDTSVWNKFFFKLKDKKEVPLVVEVSKLDKQEERVVGSVSSMSRPFEPDRSLILEFTDEWDSSHQENPYPIKSVYVDTKSGIIVKELLIPNVLEDEQEEQL